MLRRSVLKAIGLAPVAAAVHGSVGQPLGQAGDKWQFAQAAQTSLGIPLNKPDPVSEGVHKAMWAWVRGNKGYLDDLRDHINRETHVSYIDPDLLAMRSLSQAARIYYMRQRLVERGMKIQLDDNPYTGIHDIHMRWTNLAKKALGVALG